MNEEPKLADKEIDPRGWDIQQTLWRIVQRNVGRMIVYDICGVQPMTGPTGAVFAMKASYKNPITRRAHEDEIDPD